MATCELPATPPQSSTSSARCTRHSQTASPLKKRSPSPIVSFTASSFPNDAKGVKNITQHVIRSLEGLGHFDFEGRMVGIDEQVEPTLVDGYNAVQQIRPNTPKRRQRNGHAKTASGTVQNGAARSAVAQRQKIDWEIPRKLLHSSIGACHSCHQRRGHVNEQQVSLHYTFTYRKEALEIQF